MGGVQLGFKTILTLSGWSSLETLDDCSYRPDLIVNSIAELDIDRLLEMGVANYLVPEELKKELQRLKKQYQDDDQFQDKLPADDVG